MNPFDIVKNLQNLQGQMGDIQEKLNEITAEGFSGGEMVRVVLNGQMEVQELSLSPIVVDSRDIKMLEDLIMAAFNDAQAKIRVKMQSELGSMALPPGFPGTR